MEDASDMTSKEFAALWNQHEICPECKSSEVEEIDMLVHDFFRHRHEKKYRCKACGCVWL